MIVYKLVWNDRNGKYTEWLGTKASLSTAKANVHKTSTKRPYDQVEVEFSGQIDIPTSKGELLSWLNRCVR